MDIVGLKTFLSLAETGSFSRTAETLFVTQPAVSKRITTLEQSVGMKLFDRIGKTVQLTQAGKALIPGSQRILAELDESMRVLSNLHGSTEGTLSMATSHHIGLHRLPSVLQEYTRQYPDVELDIRFMDSEQAFPMILNGEIEFALVTLPAQPLPNLKQLKVWSEPMRCVIGRQHVLADKKITRKQLQQTPAILQAKGTYTRELVDNALGELRPANILLETHYLETIKAMVQSGLGWSMLPDSMIDDSLRIINIQRLKTRRQLGIVLHEKRTLSNAADSLLRVLDIEY